MIGNARILAVLALAVVPTACVLSVAPVVPESGAAFDARLLGSWEEVSGRDRAIVTRSGASTYAIDYTDGDGRTGRFEARLGRLGEHLVLDVRPARREAASSAPDIGTMIAGHLLLTVDIGADTVRVANLEPDSLRAAIRRGTVGLAQAEGDEQLVLTATTDRLRSALASYIERPGALATQDVWRRARGPA